MGARDSDFHGALMELKLLIIQEVEAGKEYVGELHKF